MRIWSHYCLCVLVLAGGCRSPQPTTPANPAAPIAPAPMPPSAPSLVGTSWLAEDIGGRGVVDLVQSTLTFESDTRIVGSTGCNRYFASLQLSGTALRIANGGSTLMACIPAVGDQEARFLAALEATRAYRIDSRTSHLWLLDQDGNELARLTQMPAASSGAQGSPGRASAQRLLGTYTGTLPCADCSGIRTELSLYSKGPNDFSLATYMLSQTYLGTRDGDRTIESAGRWTVLRGMPSNVDATIYQLNFDRPDRTMNFLRVGENELELLDRQQRQISSPANHILRRTAARVGGYVSADLAAPDVRAAAEFAVAEQSRRLVQAVLLQVVSNAEKQIVAGTNYRLCLSVRIGAAPQSAIVVIYRDLQNRYSLISWQTGPCSG